MAAIKASKWWRMPTGFSQGPAKIRPVHLEDLGDLRAPVHTRVDRTSEEKVFPEVGIGQTLRGSRLRKELEELAWGRIPDSSTATKQIGGFDVSMRAA